MKKYEAPEIIDYIDIAETVFAASGEVAPPSNYSVSTYFRNNNGGSHTDAEVYCNTGSKITSAGNVNFTMTLHYNGTGKIVEIGQVTKATSYAISADGKEITFTYNGWANPGENMSFGITGIKVDKGITSDTGSIYASGTHINEDLSSAFTYTYNLN